MNRYQEDGCEHDWTTVARERGDLDEPPSPGDEGEPLDVFIVHNPGPCDLPGCGRQAKEDDPYCSDGCRDEHEARKEEDTDPLEQSQWSFSRGGWSVCMDFAARRDGSYRLHSAYDGGEKGWNETGDIEEIDVPAEKVLEEVVGFADRALWWLAAKIGRHPKDLRAGKPVRAFLKAVQKAVQDRASLAVWDERDDADPFADGPPARKRPSKD